MGVTITITDETGREVTLLEQTEAALEAWAVAEQAVQEAWRITPKQFLKQRSRIPRNYYNQNIALDCTRSLKLLCGRGRDMIVRSQQARARGDSWAAPTDEVALREALPE
jgi:hypothetical protein